MASKRKTAKETRRAAWGTIGGVGGVTRILGVDISSTNVGLCLLLDRDPWVVKTIELTSKDRDVRLRQLESEISTWMFINKYLIHGLAYEGPAPEAKSGGWMNSITQAQAVGIVKAAWFRNLNPADQYPGVIEVPIQHGKSALAGSHRADKEQMIATARLIAPHFDWNEHSADAFGIGLAAYVYLEQERQTAAYERQLKEERR